MAELLKKTKRATLAQLVEHLIRNERVVSSILTGGSTPLINPSLHANSSCKENTGS
jgi:hypothetical protein